MVVCSLTFGKGKSSISAAHKGPYRRRLRFLRRRFFRFLPFGYSVEFTAVNDTHGKHKITPVNRFLARLDIIMLHDIHAGGRHGFTFGFIQRDFGSFTGFGKQAMRVKQREIQTV